MHAADHTTLLQVLKCDNYVTRYTVDRSDKQNMTM